jgi:hypothetical protein
MSQTINGVLSGLVFCALTVSAASLHAGAKQSLEERQGSVPAGPHRV